MVRRVIAGLLGLVVLLAPNLSFALNTKALADATDCCKGMAGSCNSESPLDCCKKILVRLDTHGLTLSHALQFAVRPGLQPKFELDLTVPTFSSRLAVDAPSPPASFPTLA